MHYLAPILSFLMVFGMLRLLLKGAMASAVLDHPNQRSLHIRPIPRTGGLSVIWRFLAHFVVARVFVGLPGLHEKTV